MDKSKVAEVGLYVQRESMLGHPAGDVYPYEADLGIADPDSRKARPTPTPYAVFRQNGDHHFLKAMNIEAHISAIPGEIQDRIAHQLPWAVVGHIAAAIACVHRDAHLCQNLSSGQYILAPSSSP